MTVTDKIGIGGPLFRPYPNWNWYNRYKCITSVYLMRIKCNLLFVVVSGKFRDWDKVCPARILIFDLSTDKLIKNIIIPSNIANNKNDFGLLTTVLVEAPNCNNIINTATIYISDTRGYGLIIYDAAKSKFCRIESNFMKPRDTNFVIKNKTIKLEEGIYGLTTIPK